MGNCDFSLPALPTNNKTPGRACYSTRCFVVCPNSVPIKNRVFGLYFNGGDEEDRTLDLTDANRTLSQLSYAPIGLLCDYKIFFAVCQVFGGGLEKFFFAAPVFMPSACRHRPSFRAWSIPQARRESALSCCCCCRRRGIPY